jgi:hypothetical protein
VVQLPPLRSKMQIRCAEVPSVTVIAAHSAYVLPPGLVKRATFACTLAPFQAARAPADETVSVWIDGGLHVHWLASFVIVPTATPLSRKFCASALQVESTSRTTVSAVPFGGAGAATTPTSTPFTRVGTPEMMSCGTTGLLATQGTVATFGAAWAAFRAGRASAKAPRMTERRFTVHLPVRAALPATSDGHRAAAR